MTQAECVADYLERTGGTGAIVSRPGEVVYLTRGYVRETGSPVVRWRPVSTASLIPERAAEASAAADVECLEAGRLLRYAAPWAPVPGLWCYVTRVPLGSGLVVVTLEPAPTRSLVSQARAQIARRCGEFPAYALTDDQVCTYLRASSLQQSEGAAARSSLLHAGARSLRTVSRHLEALERLGVTSRARVGSRVELGEPIYRLGEADASD